MEIQTVLILAGEIENVVIHFNCCFYGSSRTQSYDSCEDSISKTGMFQKCGAYCMCLAWQVSFYLAVQTSNLVLQAITQNEVFCSVPKTLQAVAGIVPQ
jgi:hypothetical protein